MNYIDEIKNQFGAEKTIAGLEAQRNLACIEVDQLRNKLIKANQELLDYSEDFAFLGLPHGSKEERYLIQSDQLHKMRNALNKIFAWWDLHDGHLMTAFNTPVSKEMKELKSQFYKDLL